jgi:hypothetical protein
MNVEIVTDTTQFLFWEYLSRIFGILSLQCNYYELLYLGLSNLTKNSTLFTLLSIFLPETIKTFLFFLFLYCLL